MVRTMERVICIKCGSIGYTASPEQVPCSECGGRHKVIRAKCSDFKRHFQKEGDTG